MYGCFVRRSKLFLGVVSNEENAFINNFISTAQELCEWILRYLLSEFSTVPETIK